MRQDAPERVNTSPQTRDTFICASVSEPGRFEQKGLSDLISTRCGKEASEILRTGEKRRGERGRNYLPVTGEDEGNPENDPEPLV